MAERARLVKPIAFELGVRMNTAVRDYGCQKQYMCYGNALTIKAPSRCNAARNDQEPLMSQVTKQLGVVVGLLSAKYREESAKRSQPEGICQNAIVIGAFSEFSGIESWCTLGVDGEDGPNSSLPTHRAATARRSTSDFKRLGF
jgi:hypothetical protein